MCFKKQCTKCLEVKDVSFFYKKKNGYRPSCKNCIRLDGIKYREANREKVLTKSREYRKANINKELERSKKYRETHKEERKAYYEVNKEALIAYQVQYRKDTKEYRSERARRYREKNKDDIKAIKRKDYQNNKDRYILKAKEYRIQNTEKISEYNKTDARRSSQFIVKSKRRRAVKDGDLTIEQVKNILSETKECYWCGCELSEKHLDHYIPIALNGKNTISNIVVSCPKCNMSKGKKHPNEFANSIGKLL